MSDRGHIYGGMLDREKRYVDVVSLTTADGLITPLTIVWNDGRRYQIDRVTSRRQAHSLKTGGTGMRYDGVPVKMEAAGAGTSVLALLAQLMEEV